MEPCSPDRKNAFYTGREETWFVLYVRPALAAAPSHGPATRADATKELFPRSRVIDPSKYFVAQSLDHTERSGAHDQGSTMTGNPTQASRSKACASQLASRKQPCDSVRPTFSGSGVP